MATNNYHWPSERAISKRSNRKYDVDALDMLASKVGALAQRFDKLGSSNSGISSGMMYEVSLSCNVWYPRAYSC